MRIICDELGEVVYKWKRIGLHLGIPHHKLMEFKKDDDPLIRAVNYWLKGNVEDVAISWKSIVAALNSSHVREAGLAKRLSKKYCNEGEGKGNTLAGSYMLQYKTCTSPKVLIECEFNVE